MVTTNKTKRKPKKVDYAKRHYEESKQMRENIAMTIALIVGGIIVMVGWVWTCLNSPVAYFASNYTPQTAKLILIFHSYKMSQTPQNMSLISQAFGNNYSVGGVWDGLAYVYVVAYCVVAILMTLTAYSLLVDLFAIKHN